MNIIASQIERHYASQETLSLDKLKKCDVVITPGGNFAGIALSDEFLMIDMKRFYSMRFKRENFGFLKIHGYKFKDPDYLNQKQIQEYFMGNRDNPYAVQHVLCLIRNGKELTDPTQFPPLSYMFTSVERKNRLSEMEKEAEIGDVICTFNSNGALARLIRKIDRGPWSHVAMIGPDKTIVEMTTSGISSSRFESRFQSPQENVALYRFKAQLSSAEKDAMSNYMDQSLRSSLKFGWTKVMLIALWKTLHIRSRPFQSAFCPSDFMYCNQYRLITYA